MSQLRDAYEHLVSAENAYEIKKRKVAELERATFGEISRNKDLARRFFTELAESPEEVRTANKKVQEEKASLKKLEEDFQNAQQNFLTTLGEIRFPLKMGAEGIEARENEIVFRFDSEIDKDILDKISKYLGPESISSKDVEVKTDGIVVRDYQEVTDAMEKVLTHVEIKIRKAAANMLKLDSYVVQLHNRDYKIQRMLYVLYEADMPLRRRDMEIRSKLESGDLRGVLYLVRDRDPYLKQLDGGEFTLSDIGKRVMERYVEKYGSPMEEEEETTSSPQLNN